jgi:hypothetical protein
MMKAKVLLATLMTLTVASGAAFADLEGYAQAHVYVEVVANVSVGVQTAVVDLGSVQTGRFAGTVVFRVDANVERLDLQVVATDLYKGDSPTAESIIPLVGPGARIVLENGSEVQAGDGVLEWDTATILNELDGQISEIGTFESGQNGHFSQAVDVTVNWDQTDPELPMGEYSGFVQLCAMIMPDATNG